MPIIYQNATITNTLSVLEIMSPQWSDFVLTTNIPHSKAYVFVLHCFNIEACENAAK